MCCPICYLRLCSVIDCRVGTKQMAGTCSVYTDRHVHWTTGYTVILNTYRASAVWDLNGEKKCHFLQHGILLACCSLFCKYNKLSLGDRRSFKIRWFWYLVLVVDCVWNVMAHAQKPDFVFRRKGARPFKSAGASVQSTTGSRGVRISSSNAGYSKFRGSVKGTGYPLHSPVSPSLPLPCVTVCHHVSTGLYNSITRSDVAKYSVMVGMPVRPHLVQKLRILNKCILYNVTPCSTVAF